MLEGGYGVKLRNASNSNSNPSKERRRSFIVEVNITLEDGKKTVRVMVIDNLLYFYSFFNFQEFNWTGDTSYDTVGSSKYFKCVPQTIHLNLFSSSRI